MSPALIRQRKEAFFRLEPSRLIPGREVADTWGRGTWRFERRREEGRRQLAPEPSRPADADTRAPAVGPSGRDIAGRSGGTGRLGRACHGGSTPPGLGQRWTETGPGARAQWMRSRGLGSGSPVGVSCRANPQRLVSVATVAVDGRPDTQASLTRSDLQQNLSSQRADVPLQVTRGRRRMHLLLKREKARAARQSYRMMIILACTFLPAPPVFRCLCVFSLSCLPACATPAPIVYDKSGFYRPAGRRRPAMSARHQPARYLLPIIQQEQHVPESSHANNAKQSTKHGLGLSLSLTRLRMKGASHDGSGCIMRAQAGLEEPDPGTSRHQATCSTVSPNDAI